MANESDGKVPSGGPTLTTSHCIEMANKSDGKVPSGGPTLTTSNCIEMANESDGKVPSGGPTLSTSQGTDGGVTNSQRQVLKKYPNSGSFRKYPKFEGRICELFENIYDCSNKQANRLY
jgi:hypothetical protein